MTDITNDRRSGPAGNRAPVRQHDEGDGTFSEAVGSHLRAWDATDGAWVRVLADHATGGLVTSGGAAGGGAATIADGADVAQGTTTDVAWVAGAGTVISLLKKIASAGGSAVSVADGADVAQGTTTDLSSANTVVGILKAIKAAITGTLTTTTSWAAAQHVIVDSAPSTAVTGTVTADTEFPAAAALSDNVANPTTPMTGSSTMVWDITLNAGAGGWSRAPGSSTAGLKMQSAQLPAALAAGGGLKIEGVAGGVAQPVSGTFFQATQPVSLAAAVPVTDNAGSLTVDAPVGTPAFVRLSDGAAAITTLPVSLATNTPDVTDRAARLLGIVDKGKIWDGTNIAGVKAASVVAVAADPALVMQHSPQRADAGTLVGTTLSAANTGVTLTISAAAAGLFHYITSIEIVATNPTITAIAASTTSLAWTTTNLNGLVWNAGTLLAAGAEKVITRLTPATPIKSAVAATNSTIVAPAVGTGGLCRIQVTYYTAP